MAIDHFQINFALNVECLVNDNTNDGEQQFILLKTFQISKTSMKVALTAEKVRLKLFNTFAN